MTRAPECDDLDQAWVEERLGFKVEDATDIFFSTVDLELDQRYIWPPQRRAMEELALELCGRCPVEARCREKALAETYADDFGVWGGMTQKQRRRHRKVGRGQPSKNTDVIE